MSKIYSGQLLTLQLETLTDISTGSPTLTIEVTKDDGVTVISKSATLVAGSATDMECLLTASDTTITSASAVNVKVQAVVQSGSQAPWRGETNAFYIYPNWN